MLVSKWGNSLAVRLPKKLVDEMGLVEGDEIQVVAARKGALEVQKVDRRAAFLKAMEQFRFSLPPDYRFDRDEANER
jgi:antitoxin MazE